VTRRNESPYLEFYVSKKYLINVAFNNVNLSISVCITREYVTKDSLSNSVISLNLISFMASMKVLLTNILSCL
jgi:hypothetical protein